MTKATRTLLVGLAMTGLMAVGRPAMAAELEPPVVSHVRSTNLAILELILQATNQSATFRGLVDTINASSDFVYVEEGVCGHGVRSCLMSVTVTHGHRLLWVYVDTHRSDRDLMGSIGHELRHTVEVLENPAIRTRQAMNAFYSQVGYHGTSTAFETMAAIAAGDAVRAELRKHRASVNAN